MDITWYGLSCFRLSERGLISVVADPYDASVGLPPLKLKADVVTVSHEAPGHSSLESVKIARRIISSPGEYEIGGVFITGIRMTPSMKGGDGAGIPNILFVFDFNGVTVAHLGDLAAVPTQSQIEDLGAVDIALVPVGGGNALAPSKAAEVISLIEPSIVIPMHYMTYKKGPQLDTEAGFLKEMGISELVPLPSLKVTKSSLTEETQVVLLEVAS